MANLEGIPNAKEVSRAALIAATKSLLSECTEKQVSFFHKIQDAAPWNGFENCDGDHLSNAYDLVRRTVWKNRKGRTV